MGARLLAIVAEGAHGRYFLPPTEEMTAIAQHAIPTWKPDVEFFQQALGFRIGNYGMTKWSDLFTDRQTVALSTFADLIQDAREKIKHDSLISGMRDDGVCLNDGGAGALAYADAVAVYLAIAVSRATDYWGTGAIWESGGMFIAHVFTRNALPMTWDYPEANPFGEGSGSWNQTCIEWIERYIKTVNPMIAGIAIQSDAQTQITSQGRVVSTDPPYYDNIGYADLSDYFYVWLRRSLRAIFPQLFTTLAVPKAEELVATPDRHGGREGAEKFFLDGMTLAMRRIAEQAHIAFPVTIYYAFKQAESDQFESTASTGWETFLDAVIRSGFSVVGTWPVRTERSGRMRDTGSNALATSIVLVCRKRPDDAPIATRRELLTVLKSELPVAIAHLQRGNIAPVDLAQSAIGPGMAVYTRYAKVLDAEGKIVSVRDALTMINEVLDEAMAEQEGDFDSDTRWALVWFEQVGFNDGAYGDAEQLSKAKNTSIAGLGQAGILSSKGGKVRLFRPVDLPVDWDPRTDARLTVWEMVHHLIRVLEAGGESAAAKLVAALGTKAEVARELAYRLYTLCERKKRAAEAMSYNGLVQSWPEIVRLSREAQPNPAQGDLLL
jgi:putative DNA methylase